MIAMAINASGCKKLIEIDPPINETPSATIYTSDKAALGALSGMYTYFSQAGIQTTGLSVNNSLMADDLRYLGAVTSIQDYANNTYTSVTASNDQFTSFYGIIYRANAIILGLQQYNGTTDRIKTQLTAEAKLMRAYCYFHLVNLFGDVPLVLQTDVNVTAVQPRETVTNVYSQIIADLTDAKANLLADYSFTSSDRIGVNRFTAAALLARVYLFTGNYQAAEQNASEVIASNLYSIIPSATMGTALFVRNSAESIWQLPPPLAATNQYVTEAASFIPASNTTAAVNYQLQPDFLQIFQSGDLRRSRWMSDLTISGTVYTIPVKYKYRTQALAVAANVSECQVILRLAEQYLIRAESRARQGNTSGALSDLNVIRLRSGVPASTTTTQSALVDEILLENRRELFCEQGLRWYTLKRSGQADAVLTVLKPTYQPFTKLYPFAQTILNVNSNLVQNPGY